MKSKRRRVINRVPARKGQKYKPRTKAPTFTDVLKCALCPRTFKRAHSQHKYCGRCRRKAVLRKMKEWHRANADPEKQRRYYRNHYAENAAEVIARTKAYAQTERGKKARRKAGMNQLLHNANKVAARMMVRAALIGGILTKQPCESCGALKVEAHHEDYNEPLKVNWLCNRDHRRLHKERGDGVHDPQRPDLHRLRTMQRDGQGRWQRDSNPRA